MTQTPILELRKVAKSFAKGNDIVSRAARKLGLLAPNCPLHAVQESSLQIWSGEIVGLVGESGCGKSTLGRLAAGLIRPTCGAVLQDGKDVSTMTRSERRQAKLKTQMIFQNPYASLNPRAKIGQAVGEAARFHGLLDDGSGRTSYEDYVESQLARVGLDSGYKNRFPHQLSGGQRQRVAIARALAVKPHMLICDEVVSALDVSVQAQILNLFIELRDRLNLTYLFVSHDLHVIRYLSDRVVVMYLGQVVEEAPAEQIYRHPNHPYTRALLAEVPRLGEGKSQFTAIKGEMPSPLDPPKGCPFHPRCIHATARCAVEAPAIVEIAPGHRSACHLNQMSH